MTEPTEGIPFRRRADLVVVPASRGTDHAWTVKDPLTLRYYQLRAEEFAILELLDGRRSIADLLRGLHQKFPGHRLSAQNVAAFVGQLLKSELLTATSFGFGRQLADSYTRSQRHAAWRRLGSLLSIRFRGVDPTRFLSAIQPATRVLFSRPALVAMLLLIASAAVVGLSRLDTILQRLPSLSGLTHPANLPVILATFVVIKVLHELGHAAVCRHLGGECHEVGFILVAFMPLLYCDVTDSWMNSSRVQRIAVSLAGILVELVLASLCLFLWLRAAPGPESALLLNVVLICSVSTLLFNGNPLLRYDGYYVLSDWLGIPNLSSESRRELWALFDSWVLGVVREPSEPGVRRVFLCVYGLASVLYRWVVLLAIVFVVYRTLDGFGLSLLSVIFIGPALLIAVLMPIVTVVARMREVVRGEPSVRWRAGVGLAVLWGVLVTVWFLPLPYHVKAPFVLQPANRTAVFVSVKGRVLHAVPVGTQVSAGDVLAVLENPMLMLESERQRLEVDELRLRVRHLNSRRTSDPAAASRLHAVEQTLASAARRMERLEQEVDALTIRSPRAGIVYPPPNVPVPVRGGGGSHAWAGTPMDAHNVGAFLESQTLLCYVARPEEIGAVLFVSGGDVEFVRPGQRVELQPVSRPNDLLSGRVTTVAAVRSEDIRREIAAAGLLAPGRFREAGPTYFQSRAGLDEQPWSASLYAPGRARIRAGRLSVGRRVVRSLRRIFATEL